MTKRRARKGEGLRFIKELDINSQKCILWPFGVTDKGYGSMYIDKKHWGSHQYSLTMHFREAARDEICCHKPNICHNRLCINPNHLYWGSHKENIRDRWEDGTSSRGENSGNSKLTEKDVLKIKPDPRKYSEIAHDYGVSYNAISNIKNERTWGWLVSDIVKFKPKPKCSKKITKDNINFIVESDLTQEQIGKMLNVSAATISNTLSKHKYSKNRQLK